MLLSSIKSDPTLTNSEKSKLTRFSQAVEAALAPAHDKPSSQSSWKSLKIFTLARCADIDYYMLPKDGIMLTALWVCLLHVLDQFLSAADMKYPTYEDWKTENFFYFSGETEEEHQNLWKTANWMNILFNFIPAKKNKGLAMMVVPKLAEGWTAKYVTGSGQTHRTALRVRVFELEGNIVPRHRGKVKSSSASRKKRLESTQSTRSVSRTVFYRDTSNASNYSTRSRSTTQERPKKRRSSARPVSTTSRQIRRAEADDEYSPYKKVYLARETSSRYRKPAKADDVADDEENVLTDNSAFSVPRARSSVATKAKHPLTKELSVFRDDSTDNGNGNGNGLLMNDLSRSNSLALWLDPNINPTLKSETMPSLARLDRFPTWRESEIDVDVTGTSSSETKWDLDDGDESYVEPILDANDVMDPFSPLTLPPSGSIIDEDKMREVFGLFMFPCGSVSASSNSHCNGNASVHGNGNFSTGGVISSQTSLAFSQPPRQTM